ncbi:MAG: PEGA domain-containing protein, partial [Burkholderiales bacterium]|nr:PEGA domain-containing protein [Burkholderiales bacterium]
MHGPDPIPRHAPRRSVAAPAARTTRIALALAAAAVAGCASLGEQPGRIAIASDPPGAEVYVMGRRVGVTPLAVEQRLIFPPTYPGEQQALYGMVELRRPGCASVQRAVSVRGVARGVEVKLDCGAGARPAAEATTAAPAAVPAAAPRPAA